jgi:hypothetical protein
MAAARPAEAVYSKSEAGAKRRLVNKYDAARYGGEVASGRSKTLPGGNASAQLPSGLSSKDTDKARIVQVE